MKEADDQPKEDRAPSLENVSFFQYGIRRDDVVFFRMDTPSQLENEYDFGPILGEGTFGVVYRGLRKTDRAKCAIKKILRERTFSSSERARLDREISILRQVKHPCIIELLAVAESPSILFLITELCEGDSLAGALTALPKHAGFEEFLVMEIIRQVASALSYLHNRGIVHRDLKAGNIMLLHKVDLSFRRFTSSPNSFVHHKCRSRDSVVVSESHRLKGVSLKGRADSAVPQRIVSSVRMPQRSRGARVTARHLAPLTTCKLQVSDENVNIQSPSTSTPPRASKICLKDITPAQRTIAARLKTKLIDFGLAVEVRKTEEALANACGTPLYMAPEVLKGRSYTRQCDVWSLGILMYQLLTGEMPLTASTEEQLLEQINKFDISSIVKSLDFITPLAQEFLLKVLRMDPAYRYSASEILFDPWITQFATQFNEEFVEKPEVTKRISECMNDQSTKASLNSQQVDSLAVKSGPPPGGSRTPSMGFPHSPSTHSVTNVLELMKQYHRELTGHKEDTVSLGGKSNDSSSKQPPSFP